MSGVDTVRGIGFQQAHAIVAVLDALGDPDFGAIRIEGADDIVDIEVFGRDDRVVTALQIKTRGARAWGEAELLDVLRRWARLPAAAYADFEFVTDGRLGPSGEKVADALAAAGSGNTADLAVLLGEVPAGAVCVALSRARIRHEPAGISALLDQAERQVSSMLPAPRTAHDVREQAEQAIDRVFRKMFERTADSDPQVRRFTRAELAELLGVPVDQPASVRWPGDIRGRYLQVAKEPGRSEVAPAFIEGDVPGRASIRSLDVGRDSGPRPVTAVLDGTRSAVIYGGSGAGKTTAAAQLRREAAEVNRVVLVAHAEAYLPGRIAALAADALAEMVRHEVPTSTGRQALADPNVTLIIDGVSEVPASVREQLREDVRAPLAAGHGARIVLLGRDVAAMNSVLPTSRPSEIYVLSPLAPQRQVELAVLKLTGRPSGDPAIASQMAEIHMCLARAEEILGSAVENPMLLGMALEAQSTSPTVASRAGLFQQAVEQVARRGAVANVAELSAGLGIVYCSLLDSERRYADAIEWPMLIRRATSQLAQLGIRVDPEALDADARRCGLVSPLGWRQTLVPVHDAFADYLAGFAHGRSLVPMPGRLRPGDTERMMFAAEVGGVDEALAATVTRDLPFAAVGLARHDQRPLVKESIDEIEYLLALLWPRPGNRLSVWDRGRGAALALYGPECKSGWVDGDTARQLMIHTSAAALDQASPLKVAVRLWRLMLVTRFGVALRREGRAPLTVEDVRVTLADYKERTATLTRELVAEVAPQGHGETILANMPSLGLRAAVGPSEISLGGIEWPVAYQHSDSVDTDLPYETAGPLDGWGHSTFRGLTSLGPPAEARDRVRTAIERLTTNNWLAP